MSSRFLDQLVSQSNASFRFRPPLIEPGSLAEALLPPPPGGRAVKEHPIGSISFSKVNDPKGIRTPVHPLWRYEE